MDASVIVPARDAAETLPGTLDGLGGQAFDGRFEVIVVDNGSLDDTARLAERSAVVTQVIRRHRGAGPGAARNAGVAASSGSVLAFLDADCRPESHWLRSGVNAMAELDLVQGRILPDDTAPLGPFDRTLSVGGAHGLFESANLFVTRRLFADLGGFPAGLESSAWRVSDRQAPFGEDVIFGWQAVRSGARTGFCAEALAYHEVRARGPRAFVAERSRLALFPHLAATVPELRERFFYHRSFHSPRSASFDLALAGTALAAVMGRRLPLVAALPYVRLLAAGAHRWGIRRAPEVACAEVLADALGALALLRGSIASGSLLL
jgi:glycosyltransferase involved in cell wall biosynthesis